jgi:Zn-dependent protease/CBS domain-containing protein
MTTHSEAVPTAAEPRRGIELFRLYGIKVRLDWSWFLIFLLLLWSLSSGYLPSIQPEQSTLYYWVAGGIAVLLFFASILLHELAHSLVARAYGLEVPAITLFVFGGVSELKDEPTKPTHELLIAVVGPLTSFLLAGVFWALHRAFGEGSGSLVAVIAGYLAWVNLALGVFNLLPGFPLDGGRVLRAILWWRSGSLARATRVAADIGKTLALGIMMLGAIQIFLGSLIGGLWLVFIGMFLRGGAEASQQSSMLRRAIDRCTVAQVMRTDPVVVPSGTTVRRFVEDFVLARGFRGFPVVAGDRPLGVVTLLQVREVPRELWDERTVDEVMRQLDPSISIRPEAPLTDALQKLGQTDVGRLLVLDGDRLAGMLSKDALMRFVEIRKVLAED